MSLKQKAASWAVAIAAICGFGTAVVNSMTNRDTDHVTAAGTIAAVGNTRWQAHDREHDRAHLDSVRQLGVLRDLFEDLADVRSAIKACRTQIDLLTRGRPNAARRDLTSTGGLIPQRTTLIDTMSITMPREKILDMPIDLSKDTIKKAAQDTYK